MIVTIIAIPSFGLWRGRGSKTVNQYLLAGKTMPWYAMGLSIMATQASAITFIATTGQAYVDGMRFVQFYFGLPIAMVILSATAVPIFHRAGVYTAYEYLEKRFDAKTRALAAIVFLIQRGMAVGLALYAPAIVMSVIFGWPDRVTTLIIGIVCVLYTTKGGIPAVTWTDVLQMSIIFSGLILGADHGGFADAARRELRGRRVPGGRGGQAERRRSELRPEQPLQPLERPDRRIVPGARLFRLRSVAGAALSDRQIRGAEQAQPAVQRHGEGADAVLHPVRRRDGVSCSTCSCQPPMLFEKNAMKAISFAAAAMPRCRAGSTRPGQRRKQAAQALNAARKAGR